mgnify:FL=1
MQIFTGSRETKNKRNFDLSFSITSSSLSESSDSSESSELSGFAATLAGGTLDLETGLATTLAG